MTLGYNDFIFENVKYVNNPLVVHIHSQEEFDELMSELDKEDFFWAGNKDRPALSENNFAKSSNYVILNFQGYKTIFTINHSMLIDLKPNILRSFKVVEFESKRKKIRRPDIDPFDEEDWGYMDESNNFVFEGSKFDERLSIHVHNEEEFDNLMVELEKRGFCWIGDKNLLPTSTRYETGKYKADIIILNYREHRDIYQCPHHQHVPDYGKIVEFDDLDIKIRKKIKRPDIDPFDEEDWGYMDESNNFVFESREYEGKLAIHVRNSDEYHQLMKELEEQGYCWMGDRNRPPTSENYYTNFGGFSRDIIIINYRKNKDIYQCREDDYRPVYGVLIEYGDKRGEKKIRRPDIDPFNEEDWGYEDVNEKCSEEDLRKYAISFNSADEAQEIADMLIHLGFKVYAYDEIRESSKDWTHFIFDPNPGDGEFDLCGDFLIKLTNAKSVNLEEFLEIIGVTKSKKKNKIRRPDIDPFDEEDWGYEEEN